MNLRTSKAWWWILALSAVLLLGPLACAEGESRAEDGDETGEAGEDGEEGEEDSRAPVEVAVLERGPIEAVLRFSADLEAERSVSVYARAPYRVTSLRVEEGDRVRRGDTLASLERDAQENAVAKVESQLAKARRDHERQQRLFEQELISQETFHQATYEIEQLEIALQEARRELSYTTVEAPIDGIVTRRLVKRGDQVTVNEHLFDLVDFDSLVARVYVSERELARVRGEQPVRIRAQALPGRAFVGRVDRIAPVVDPRTGTVKVTVNVPWEEGLRPGMFLDVEIVTAVEERALLVPKRALVLDDDEVYVFRMTDEGTAERVAIVPALEAPGAVAVADGELAPGQRVIIAGQAGIKAGDEVRIVSETAAAPPAEASAGESPGE